VLQLRAAPGALEEIKREALRSSRSRLSFFPLESLAPRKGVRREPTPRPRAGAEERPRPAHFSASNIFADFATFPSLDSSQEAVDAILDVAYRTGCDKTGPAYLPTRRRKYTILKSPHVNKDSREQFEIRTHQRLIDLKNVSAQTIDGLMALDLPAGVDVEVKI